MELEQIRKFSKALQVYFGDICEVVIHDLTKPHESLLYIYGDLTGRKVGDPATNIILDLWKQSQDDNDQYFITEMQAKSGKILKSLTVFTKENNQLKYGICVLIDTTLFRLVANQVNYFLENKTLDKMERTVNENILDIAENMIDITIGESSLTVDLMQKEEKIEIVKKLEEKGIFLLKGSIEVVARKLCVSRYTIYNYLDEVRTDLFE